jgi:N-methylhydantoinase A
MVEIGAGGGSIARTDRLGRVGVGPDSAGADPGPACYGRGGTAPTVTDADLLLGRIDPAAFAGGQVALDPQKARAALGTEDFAYAVAELVDEAMANAARVHAVESGKTLAERTLIAFGGAAPLHVARVADKLGIERILVPPFAGVGSAVGFLRAPISYEVARSCYARLSSLPAASLNSLLKGMAEEAREIVRRGAGDAKLHEQRTAFARYVGQGHEIPVRLPSGSIGKSDAAKLRREFEKAYLEQYGRLIDGVDIEVLTWTVRVATAAATPAAAKTARPKRAKAASSRPVFDVASARRVRHAIYPREQMPPGAALAGPAIIVEDSTSTVVAPGYRARVAADGTIVMTRSS